MYAYNCFIVSVLHVLYIHWIVSGIFFISIGLGSQAVYTAGYDGCHPVDRSGGHAEDVSIRVHRRASSGCRRYAPLHTFIDTFIHAYIRNT